MTKTKISYANHVFAHVAPGPYTYRGYTCEKFQAIPGAPDCPIQPGTSCDHCSMAIMHTFWFEGTNGHKFKVGSSCVEKAGDSGIRRVIAEDVAEMRRKQAEDLDRRKTAQIDAWLADDGVRLELASLPHPLDWRAEKGETRLDWAVWMRERAMRAGRHKVHRFMKKLVTAS